MLWIFAERFFMAAIRQCEKSEGCFAVFTAQPWTAAVLFKLQFSDGLLEKPALARLPAERFDMSQWSRATVNVLARPCDLPHSSPTFSFFFRVRTRWPRQRSLPRRF